MELVLSGNDVKSHVIQLGALFITTSITIWLSSTFIIYVSDRSTEKKIKKNLINIVQGDKDKEIKITAKLSSEVTRILYNVTIPFYDTISKSLYVFFYMGFILYSIDNQKLTNVYTIIIIITIVAMVFLLLFYIIILYKKNGQKLAENASSRLEIGKSLEGIKYLLKYRMENKLAVDIYNKISYRTTKLRSVQSLIIGAVKPIIEIVAIFSMAFLFFIGEMDSGFLATLVVSGIRILPNISQIASNFTNFTSHLHAIDYVFFTNKINNSKPDIHLPARLIWLTGPSGCGKTTFLNRINYGVEINKKYYPSESVYLMKSSPQFLPLTVEELLGGVDKKNIYYELDIHKLDSKLINKLSTGERVRVDFMRMIANKPKILLIDESLSNLNEEFSVKILNFVINNTYFDFIIIVNHLKFIDNFKFHKIKFDELYKFI